MKFASVHRRKQAMQIAKLLWFWLRGAGRDVAGFLMRWRLRSLSMRACTLYWAGPLPAYRRRSHKTESRIIRAFARRGRRRIAWAANAQECGHLATGAGASPEPSGASVTRSMQNSTPALLLALLLAVSPDPDATRSLGLTFEAPGLT